MFPVAGQYFSRVGRSEKYFFGTGIFGLSLAPIHVHELHVPRSFALHTTHNHPNHDNLGGIKETAIAPASQAWTAVMPNMTSMMKRMISTVCSQITTHSLAQGRKLE